MARHGATGIAAYGSVKFVAAAAIGNAIGNAFRETADFNDCMQASGFLIADGQPVQPVAYAPPTQAPTGQPATAQQHMLVPQNASSVTPVYAPAAPQAGQNPFLVPPSRPGSDPTYQWSAPAQN